MHDKCELAQFAGARVWSFYPLLKAGLMHVAQTATAIARC